MSSCKSLSVQSALPSNLIKMFYSVPVWSKIQQTYPILSLPLNVAKNLDRLHEQLSEDSEQVQQERGRDWSTSETVVHLPSSTTGIPWSQLQAAQNPEVSLSVDRNSSRKNSLGWRSG